MKIRYNYNKLCWRTYENKLKM